MRDEKDQKPFRGHYPLYYRLILSHGPEMKALYASAKLVLKLRTQDYTINSFIDIKYYITNSKHNDHYNNT